MDRLLTVSIIECIYLIYMFRYFKTRKDFNIFTSPKNWLLKHTTDDNYSLRICPFGQVAIFVLVFILLARHFLNIPQYLIYMTLVVSFLLSLININALVYLLPVWIMEIYYLVN